MRHAHLDQCPWPCREVETLFHEFGHALQHMLTTQSEGMVAGIRGIEWDCVELPSQFMENWCYNRAVLYGFAKHYGTGEPLPEEIYQKLLAARTYRSAFHAFLPCLCHQLAVVCYSTLIEHTSTEQIFSYTNIRVFFRQHSRGWRHLTALGQSYPGQKSHLLELACCGHRPYCRRLISAVKADLQNVRR